MKSSIASRYLGLLALLCSSAGFASAVTVTTTVTAINGAPVSSCTGTAGSPCTVNVGDTFTLLVSGANFPGDPVNLGTGTIGATLGLTFSSGVSILTPTNTQGIKKPAGSPLDAAAGFSGGNAGPFPSGGVFTVTAPNLAAGNFDAFLVNFHATTAGAINFNIVDTGVGATPGWLDDQGNRIPITYAPVFVTVLNAATAVIAVTDSVAPVGDGQIPFGNVAVSTFADQTVTVTNSGGADLHVGTLAQADPLAAPFSLVNDLCSGQTLTPSSSCTVGVRFSPAAAIASNDTFSIPSDDAGQPIVTVTVSGTGTPAPTPTIVVTDSVAPASDHLVPFGNVTQGQTSTQTVTVTNSGNANLVLGTLAQADPLAAPFSLVNDLCSGQTVTPSSSCTVGVRFSPAAVIASNDTFSIPSNDSSQAIVTVSVTGTGTPIPAPNIVVTDSVAPANDHLVPFGSITVGGISAQTVTVANSGNANLVLSQIAAANPLAAPFSVSNDTCSNQSVAPAASCSFDVVFQPTAIGPFNDALDIPSNVPTVTVSVSGIGASVMVPDIQVTDSVAPAGDLQVSFPDVYVSVSGHETITVTNDGAGNLVIGNVGAANPLAAPFSIGPGQDGCSGQTLAPAATCTIGVDFSPGAIQAYNDSFDIPSNDPDQPTITVTLSGNGKPIQNSSGGSAFDVATLLSLSLFGFAVRRRRG